MYQPSVEPVNWGCLLYTWSGDYTIDQILIPNYLNIYNANLYLYLHVNVIHELSA